MRVEIELKPEVLEKIRNSILEYIEDCKKLKEEGEENVGFHVWADGTACACGGYYDGVGYQSEDGTLVYITSTGYGRYIISPDGTLIFGGRRQSFKDGTMLFEPIKREDVESYRIIESQTPDVDIF